MAKLKALREVVTTKEAKCFKEMTIPEGTTLYVMKETPPASGRIALSIPHLGRKILVVRVDNGTGHLDLMPETAVYEEDII